MCTGMCWNGLLVRLLQFSLSCCDCGRGRRHVHRPKWRKRTAHHDFNQLPRRVTNRRQTKTMKPLTKFVEVACPAGSHWYIVKRAFSLTTWHSTEISGMRQELPLNGLGSFEDSLCVPTWKKFEVVQTADAPSSTTDAGNDVWARWQERWRTKIGFRSALLDVPELQNWSGAGPRLRMTSADQFEAPTKRRCRYAQFVARTNVISDNTCSFFRRKAVKQQQRSLVVAP